MIHIFQIVIGVLGNFSLIVHYICLYSPGFRSRSTILILTHLTIANSLVICANGIPQAMAALGLKEVFEDSVCKFVSYIQRVARGVAIGSTCLLSVFQAITISPRDSRWADLKLKTLNYIGPYSILMWLLQILVNASFPIYVFGKWSNETITKKNGFGYCSFPLNDNITFLLFAVLISSHDAVCLGLMLCASSFMVFILYRHKQRVKHIYRNNRSHRSSPNIRAFHSILFLVSTFVFFYALSSIIYAYLAFFDNPSWWLLNMSSFITGCFPTISPFILLRSCVCFAPSSRF